MISENSYSGPLPDPSGNAGYAEHPERVGFFTDTSVCIGCKACEVACKTWNEVPADGFNFLGTSYDNTGALGANSWRHVAFIEKIGSPSHGSGDGAQTTELPSPTLLPPIAPAAPAPPSVDLGMPSFSLPGAGSGAETRQEFSWLMASDVCKHCTHAGCLDVCPTGALFRTEFGTVVVQQDICNGCGYCVSACPYGVIERREGDGRAWKCTLCYDRLKDGEEPACAKACPTDSIQYGNLDELRAKADLRLEKLHASGTTEARLYGHDTNDGVGGDGAFFLLLDEPEVYGLPPDPVVPTRDLARMWRFAGAAALTMVGAVVSSFIGRKS